MKRQIAAVSFTLMALIGLMVALPMQAQNIGTTIPAIVYNEAADSVVAISVVRGSANGLQQGGSGSGFVYDMQGHIITNAHVIEGATEIAVNFLDGTLTRASLVGADPDSDIAVLRVNVDPGKLQPLQFADINALFVGQSVYAIGSPFGQRWTLTSGIVSALNRTISGLENFSIGGAIQTDTAVNPGNSGGPLLDENARVVGVTSQILSESGSNSGIGFAIPADLVQRVAVELIQRGFVEYSYIGIGGSNMSLAVIEAFNLPEDTQGVIVANIVAGGPASRSDLRTITTTGQDNNARLQSVDILTAINGQPLTSFEDLIGYLARNTRPGDTATFTVLRATLNGAQQFQTTVTLSQRP